MLRRLDTGIRGDTRPGMSMNTAPGMGIPGDGQTTGTQDVSALGEGFHQTPLIVPVRGHLDSIKRLLKGDVYIGRGSRQRSLLKSRYCNTFKVSQVGRTVAISSFRQALLADSALYNSLWTLSGTRPVCHCQATEDCHGDVLIEEFRKSYPAAHDRNLPCGAPPGHEVRSFLARLREEPESEEGSSPDEGVPEKHSRLSRYWSSDDGWRRVRTARILRRSIPCFAGEMVSRFSSLSSRSTAWSSVRECFWRFTTHFGTEKLLVDLAMGKVAGVSFPT